MSDKTVNDSGDAPQAASPIGSDAVVWVSDAMGNTEIFQPFSSDDFLKDKKPALDVMERVSKGEPLPAERFPKEMYVQSRFDTVKTLPDFFSAGGLWLVSSRFAYILNQHELGKTGLHPVTLFNHERTEKFPGNYYCLGFGETKDTVDLEKSRDGLRLRTYSKDKWRLRPAPKDDLVMVSCDALVGVDLWMEPRVFGAFFMSDRLVRALDTIGLAKPLDLYKCAVIN